ncbi:hypothetical protein [Thermogutta sp.]|uniref:hypothetical protein n=1 Tax=Thermogutta sp. TaxID=1962930 RepID=UPI0032209655
MVQRFASVVVLLTFAAFLWGCSKAERVKPPERNPKEELAKVLVPIAEGKLQQAGSAMGEVMNLIEQIKKTDPALGNELEADGKKIMSTQDINMVKATAQAMLQKLGAGSSGGAAPSQPSP